MGSMPVEKRMLIIMQCNDITVNQRTPVIGCDKGPTEERALRAQMAAVLGHDHSDDDYKDCGVGWALLITLE